MSWSGPSKSEREDNLVMCFVGREVILVSLMLVALFVVAQPIEVEGLSD